LITSAGLTIGSESNEGTITVTDSIEIGDGITGTFSLLSDTDITTNANIISPISISLQSTNGNILVNSLLTSQAGNIQLQANLGTLSFGVDAGLVSTTGQLSLIAGKGEVIEAAGGMNFTAATGLFVSNPLSINGDATFDVADFNVQQDITTTNGGNIEIKSNKLNFDQASIITSAGQLI
jgi:hypothetical protein